MATNMHIEHRFACSARVLTDLLNSEDFDQRLMREALNIKRELVESHEEGAISEKQLRLTPPTKIPSFMRKIVKDTTYVEHRRWDREAMRCTWRIEMSFAKDKVDISGTMQVIPEGEQACRRVVDGTFSVRVALIGGKIEKFIVSETKQSFEQAAQFISKNLPA